MNKTVILNHKHYPVRIEGTGSIPCLIIGVGTLMQTTLSAHFKDMFTVYSCDLYWHRDHAVDPSQLTMQSICKDVIEVARQLKLENYVLMGHSCFGLVALEVAKQDHSMKGVILVGTPTGWNKDVLQQAPAYFDQHADEGRKENDRARRAHYANIKTPQDSIVSLNAYTADSARYWADYTVSDATIQKVWDGVVVDDGAMNRFFEEILPAYHLENDIEKVQCPVIMLGGPYDFDCIPLVLWEHSSIKEVLGPKLTIVDCPNAGHWPNLENPKAFDNGVAKWINQL